MFGLIDSWFKRTEKVSSSTIAKERLQLMIAYERNGNRERDTAFMEELREELLEVIKRYMNVDERDVEIEMKEEGSRSMLGISISAPYEDTRLAVKIESNGSLKKPQSKVSTKKRQPQKAEAVTAKAVS